ncbi:MAG TPA: hypothetical protein VFN35_25975 [Ktedonobacteraceae bacterium]|nr:hypothetical protein [Ktedonobacteraceae bacterium]
MVHCAIAPLAGREGKDCKQMASWYGNRGDVPDQAQQRGIRAKSSNFQPGSDLSRVRIRVG